MDAGGGIFVGYQRIAEGDCGTDELSGDRFTGIVAGVHGYARQTFVGEIVQHLQGEVVKAHAVEVSKQGKGERAVEGFGEGLVDHDDAAGLGFEVDIAARVDVFDVL